MASLVPLVLAAACGGKIASKNDGGGDPGPADGPVDSDEDVEADDSTEHEPTGCTGDDECTEDEACPAVGGCDGDPCRDDRCVDGTCRYVDIEGCSEGYVIEYRYSACCPWRTLAVDGAGACTFTIEGSPPERCDDVPPANVVSLVDAASGLGFFTWGAEHCVASSMQVDFSLRLSDGSEDNTVSCDDAACVGELCGLIDTIWTFMPSGWHEGCGCP